MSGIRNFAFILVIFAHSPLYADLTCGVENSGIEAILERRADTGFGQLRDSWADELTGKDLADQSLSKFSDRKRVNVGIVDTGFERANIQHYSFKAGGYATSTEDSHGTGVLETMMSRSRSSDISALFSWEEMRDPKRISQKLDELSVRGLLPKVLNVSFSMGSIDEVHQSFQMMADRGILLVASSGNGGDRDLDLNNQRFPGLMVGSVSPVGVASRYSQGGSAVDLMAPADFFLEVNFGKQGTLMAQGTSFAAPQVAAIMAEISSILPEISASQMETLLKATAIQTIDTRSGRHGAGVVNAFKAIEVAKRIRERGVSLSDSIFSDSSIYDFKNDALRFAQTATSGSAREREENLRRSFYLHQDESVREALVSLYRSPEVRLEAMAVFFESLGAAKNQEDSGRFIQLRLSDLSLPLAQREALARALVETEGSAGIAQRVLAVNKDSSVSAKQNLLKIAKSDDSSKALLAVEVLKKEKNDLLSPNEALQVFQNSASRGLRLVAARHLSNTQRLNLLRIQDPKNQRDKVLELYETYEWSNLENSDENLSFQLKLQRIRDENFADFSSIDFIPLPAVILRAGLGDLEYLQPFMRNWYRSQNTIERNSLLQKLNELASSWDGVTIDHRKANLRTSLVKTTKDSNEIEIIRTSAIESLDRMDKD